MKVLCVGEMMVDLLVHPVGPVAFDNDASQVEEIAIRSGGDANNNAIDLAKLGNEVYYVGRVTFWRIMCLILPESPASVWTM